MSIGEVFTLYGSDKDTAHSYGEVYDKIFPWELRARAGAVLEVGIERGGSLRAWQDVFPNAEIWGVDKDCTLVNTERIHSFHCDSTDTDAINRCLRTRQGSFSIIIDDGCHWLPEQKKTFENLLPYLKPGGIYVIEDLQSAEAMEYFCSQGFIIYDRRHVKGRGDDIIAVYHHAEVVNDG